MSNRILILFSHPLFEKSHANAAMVRYIPESEFITFHDLYECYPDFDIDVKREQELLLEHDIIVWHHPMYWYSCPPLMKQWIDMVLEHGWAYGRKGTKLQGKIIFQAITTGGKKENYSAEGRDRFTIPDLLQPFNQTAKVCHMDYLPPFVIPGTHNMTDEDYEAYGVVYGNLLDYLISHDVTAESVTKYHYLNDWFLKIKH